MTGYSDIPLIWTLLGIPKHVTINEEVCTAYDTLLWNLWKRNGFLLKITISRT